MGNFIKNLNTPFSGNKNGLTTVILFVAMFIAGCVIMLVNKVKDYKEGAEERAAVKAVKVWYREKGEHVKDITLSSLETIRVGDYDAEIERNLNIYRILKENLELLISENGTLVPDFIEHKDEIRRSVLDNNDDSLSVSVTNMFLKYIDEAAAEPYSIFKARVEHELEKINNYEKTYNEPNAHMYIFCVKAGNGYNDLVTAVRMIGEEEFKVAELSPLLPDID